MRTTSNAVRITTDVMNEPIAEAGLAFRFHIVRAGQSRGLAHDEIFEALGTRRQIESLASVAAEISAASDVGESNVIDFATRKRVSTNTQLNCEIVEDAAPGRHSSGYAILEAIGPRLQIRKLAAAAARLGF